MVPLTDIKDPFFVTIVTVRRAPPVSIRTKKFPRTEERKNIDIEWEID